MNEPEIPISEIDRKESSFMDAKELAEPHVGSTIDVENKSRINQDVIQNAIEKRSTYFRENAGSVTMSEVRRLLEEDLKSANKSLDCHKAFIKKKIEEILTTDITEPKKDVKKKRPLDVNKNKRKKMSRTKSGGNDSGDLSPQNESQSDVEKNEKGPKAKKRSAKEIKAKDFNMTEFQKITVKEDKPSISSRKKPTESVTSKETSDNSKENASEDDGSHSSVDKSPKILNIEEDAEPNKYVKKKSCNGVNRSKGQKLSATISRANDSGDISLQNESQSDGEKNEIEAKPKKRSAKKIKLQDPERGEWKQSKSSISAREKPTESTSKDSGDNSKENASESDGSHSSVEKSRKKKENHTAVSYGSKVASLKSLIKSCGMSVPPAVYRRAKQVPENEREAFLIRELEGILDKEGLSMQSSHKETMAVRKKKEKAKELEGIDMSNIVSSSRRRSTSNFIPPKPESLVFSDESGEEDDGDDGDDGDNSDDENSDGGVSSEGSEDDGDESN